MDESLGFLSSLPMSQSEAEQVFERNAAALGFE
jgi:hypothetical protein